MQNKRIVRNALTAVTQVIISGVILIFLYRYLLSSIGVEKLGVWSIVLATTSITRLGDFGFSGSVVKFVAKYVALEQPKKIDEVIQTAVACTGGATGVVLLAAYPFIGYILTHFIPVNALQDALSILPFALLSLWISSITGAYQSGLDGHQRIDLRNVLLIIGGVFYLFASMLLIPEYGFIGLAYAQVLQAVVMSILNWLLLKRQLTQLSFFPRWHKHRFSEMWRYSLQFQFSSVANMLFDPISKILLTKFGSLAMVGYYDMASRLITQIRSAIISANQVVVPVISGMHETEPERVTKIYRDSFNLLLYFAMPLYAFVFASLPLVSELWIGHYEANFVIFADILIVGWFVNTMSGSAFFANLGTGNLGWNSIGQLVVGATNVCLGVVLGYLFGGTGVVGAWGIALAVGGVVVISAYHVCNDIPFGALLLKESSKLMLASVSGVVFCLLWYYNLHGAMQPLKMLVVTAVFFGVVVFPFFWFHPMRLRLQTFSFSK